MTTSERVRILERIVDLIEAEADMRARARRYEVMLDHDAQELAQVMFTRASGYRKARLALLERAGIA